MSAEKEALTYLQDILAIIKETLEEEQKQRKDIRALNEEEKKALLESIVDVYILCCENKAALSSSRSKNLRDSAMISRLKGTFCRHSKRELVEAMMKEGVEPKPYRVHHFLNARFYETIRAVAVAKK